MCNGIRAGLFIYLFRQFFRGLPKELEDAAYLDGCGPFKTFISVMVPNAASSFLTVFIFSIVWYWNDYYVSSMYFTKANTISLKIDGIANIISMYLTGEVGVASDYIVWMEAPACLLSHLSLSCTSSYRSTSPKVSQERSRKLIPRQKIQPRGHSGLFIFICGEYYLRSLRKVLI